MYTLKYLFYSSIYIKLIVISLTLILVIIMAMGISKFKKLMFIKNYIKSFEQQFWSGIDLTQFYEANKEQNLNHPLGMIFKAVFEEWKASANLQSLANAKADIKERMLNVAHRQKVLIMQTCENYMDALSTFIHCSPFLGLLIGGSLVCIVFSLIVVVIAMPAFWFFNMKIQEISDKVDGFIIDLLHIFGRNLDGTAVNGAPAQPANAGAQMMQQQPIKEAKPEPRPVSSGDDDV